MNTTRLSEKLKEFENKPLEHLILRFCASWVLTGLLYMILYRSSAIGIEPLANVSFVTVGCCFVIFFGLLTAITLFFKLQALDRRVLFVSFLIYSVFNSFLAEDYYFIFSLTAVWALMLYYYCNNGYLTFQKPLKKRGTILLIAGTVGVFVFITGIASILRYATYSAPNYDFGIFCQVFRNLKEHFTPVSTCERDELLSHFCVHVSPVFYILLPIYYVLPSPITLQFSQVLILASAVIPLCLLAKHYHFSNLKTAVLASVLLFYPAVACGMNYDFHENCFLLPLLLWVFYAFEKQKYILLAIASLLTLSVKEDAAVYIIFFALFVAFSRRKYVLGGVLFVGAGIYFGAALLYLTKYGDGVMSTRYANYFAGQGGLPEAVKTVLANPAYVFTQLFVNRNGETQDKVLYLLQMLVPLCFIPFTGKKVSRYILLFPMLLLNLMTTYPYQYDIGFQYSFATAAFLFYLSVINLSELKPQTSKMLISTAAIAGFMCFMCVSVPRFSYYMSKLAEDSATYTLMDEYLENIPEEKSVIASTYLCPHLCDREVLYEVEYHDKEVKCDIVLFDMRGNYKDLIAAYEDLGYQKTDSLTVEGKEIIIQMEPK